MRLSSVTLAAALASLASAHPGHDLTEEILERRQFINSVHRKDLSHCSEKLRARGFESRSIARRAAAVEEARARRGFSKRDTADFLAASHDRSNLGYTESTDASVLFSGNASCLLTPEMAQGPFYVSGEFVRDDVTDGQPGIDLTLEYQVIDVDTCEPVPDVYVEIWHCNSTGVYSGVVASGNGDAEDETNMDTIFLRGIQKSDSEGVTQFKSIFPGHYPGRAPHVHVMVHTNATLMANETLGNDVYASHLGQVFFDQDLIMSVRKMAPYSTNTQELMLNANDRIVREEVGDVVDPFMNYVLLGDDLNSGLFAYMAFGINSSYTRHVTPTANYYQDGGVALPKPGNGAGPGGNGTTPGSTSTAATETSTAAAALPTLPLYGAVAGGVGLAMLLQ